MARRFSRYSDRRKNRRLPGEPGSLMGDAVRGYLYFSQWASCYILGACAAIFLPILVCGVLGYVFLMGAS